MPVIRERIGDAVGNILRDTGCSGVIVRQEFVDEHQYTGGYRCMQMVDNSVRRVLMHM